MFTLAQPGTFVQVDFWQCFNNGSSWIYIRFFPQNSISTKSANFEWATWHSPKRIKAFNSPGIRVLIQYGRFDAESQGSTDMDEILSAVYASMRETCSKHGRLGCP